MLIALLLSGWALACAGWDLSSRRIPNVLTLSGAAGAVACFAWSGFGPLGMHWVGSVAVAAIALVLGAALFAAAWVGAGDVKLWVSMALLAGPAPFLSAMLVGSVLAGLSALWLLRLGPAAPLAAGALAEMGLRGLDDGGRVGIPLAVPYGLGFVAVCWGGAL